MIAYLAAHPLQIVLVLVVALIALSLWRLQKNPRVDFNLLDLLMENGKVSKISCTFMATFLFTTWMMWYLAVNEKITEGYVGLYGTFWVTPLVARVIFGKTTGESQ